MSPRLDPEVLALKRALLGLQSKADVARAGEQIASFAPAGLRLSNADGASIVEIATLVARTCSDHEWSVFLGSGKLPEVVTLKPKQMERVRGGRLDITTSRGFAPAAVLEPLLRSGQR